jgi:hypothetical protein
MALWKTNFTTEDEDLCATRILDAWDDSNYAYSPQVSVTFADLMTDTYKVV